MNTLVSYNWLKEYLKTDLAPEELFAAGNVDVILMYQNDTIIESN